MFLLLVSTFWILSRLCVRLEPNARSGARSPQRFATQCSSRNSYLLCAHAGGSRRARSPERGLEARAGELINKGGSDDPVLIGVEQDSARCAILYANEHASACTCFSGFLARDTERTDSLPWRGALGRTHVRGLLHGAGPPTLLGFSLGRLVVAKACCRLRTQRVVGLACVATIGLSTFARGAGFAWEQFRRTPGTGNSSGEL